MTPIIIDEPDVNYLGLPPRPLTPQQRIVNEDGTPTQEYHLFLTLGYEYQRRLHSLLTGIKYPPVRPSP